MREVFRVFGSARDEGISILLVQQNVSGDRDRPPRLLPDDGRVVFSGTAGEFAKRKLVFVH